MNRLFSLFLTFCRQLLRLKCQAYSTLGDSDEDPQAEARLIDRLGKSVNDATPPKATLVAPAALYLTAILEYVTFFASVIRLLTLALRSVCEYVIVASSFTKLTQVTDMYCRM